MELSRIELLAKRSENLPIHEDVCRRGVELCYNRKATLEQFITLFEQDVSLASKLLRVVLTSPGRPAPPITVRKAVEHMGLEGVRRTIFQLEAFRQAFESADERVERRTVHYSKHSYAVALIARQMATTRGDADPDELYAAGLFHDAGLLLLERYRPHMLDIISAKSEETGLALDAIERDEWGWDHYAISAVVAEERGMSRRTVSAIRSAGLPAMEQEFLIETSIVSIADALALKAGIHHHAPWLSGVVDELAADIVGLSDEKSMELMKLATQCVTGKYLNHAA